MKPDEVLVLLQVAELSAKWPSLSAITAKANKTLEKYNKEVAEQLAKEKEEEEKKAAEEKAKADEEAKKKAEEEAKTNEAKPAAKPAASYEERRV